MASSYGKNDEVVPRFVLLYHELPPGGARPAHWDLMLEHGGVLRTWALEQELQPELEIRCRPLSDHRIAYLDYEGPVSGNRGQVTQTDHGTYATILEEAGEIRLQLIGQRYVGQLQLRRVATATSDVEAAQSWVACFALPPAA